MLVCECGSNVDIVDSEDFESEAFVEEYECRVCSRTGTYRVDENGASRTTGCVEENLEVAF